MSLASILQFAWSSLQRRLHNDALSLRRRMRLFGVGQDARSSEPLADNVSYEAGGPCHRAVPLESLEAPESLDEAVEPVRIQAIQTEIADAEDRNDYVTLKALYEEWQGIVSARIQASAWPCIR